MHDNPKDLTVRGAAPPPVESVSPGTSDAYGRTIDIPEVPQGGLLEYWRIVQRRFRYISAYTPRV